jgi:hypothetical protein
MLIVKKKKILDHDKGVLVENCPKYGKNVDIERCKKCECLKMENLDEIWCIVTKKS